VRHCLRVGGRDSLGANGHQMSSDPCQGLAPEPLTPDSRKLLLLALDAYLVRYPQVAQDLTALASKLNETSGCPRLGAIAKAILARADEPGQGFETLLDPFDLSELSAKSLPNESASQDSPAAAQKSPDRNTKR
jgi:hypothetical protein